MSLESVFYGLKHNIVQAEQSVWKTEQVKLETEGFAGWQFSFFFGWIRHSVFKSF